MTPFIEANSISVSFGGNTILDNISMVVVPGEIVTIVGPNGSGKTTLLRALTGAVRLSSGTVKRRDNLCIGYVPQKLSVDKTMPMTIGRFLSLSAKSTPEERRSALADTGIEDLENKQLSTLSGGQFQRALLARAILRKPDLLALDEPTQGLDQPATVTFYHLIERVREQTGCGVLMVSHDLHVVMSASDRVLCVNGHICCEGTPTVVSEAPEYRALFGTGTAGALALYQHHHDHTHSNTP